MQVRRDDIGTQQDAMVGRTISHYRLLEKLGEGGMGVVYLAEDTRLARRVALKFLRRESFDSADEQTRFVREARVAAALDHPNICTVYEIDQVDDLLFISMAYTEGVSLKERIQERRITVREALDVAVQVARGLEAAHEQGVIHRDIKSANIMLADDEHVRIMDFGLARVTGGSEISDAAPRAGTAAYMSPEQARSEVVDGRTDIWSLGVCLYEMLTGELPFRGDYDAAVIYSILNGEPRPICNLRSNVPAEVECIVLKALAKDREDRYPTVGDMLARMQSSVTCLDRSVSDGRTAGPRPPTIAVLPFADISRDRNQGYFCDGITEEIINDLARVEGLRVAARTSAFAFKGVKDDARVIGKKLGVQALLVGSVRCSGRRVRITAQLVDATDGYHIWSERYDRELSDVLAVQDEIAQKIVQALQMALSDDREGRYPRDRGL